MGSGELEEDPRSLRVRAFFGLPVPGPQREELGRFVAACAQVAPDFRWTLTENLHLTIRFVGNVDRSVVETIADALSGRSLAAFELDVDRIGTFGRGRAVRVVWLGLRTGANGAGALAAKVEAECLRAGLVGAISKSHPGRRASAQERSVRPLRPALARRVFQPHLTLARARAREGSRLPDLPATPQLNPWRADELILYSSRLTRAGAIYEVIRALPLQ
jgi:RNA 2',3'-cyclic 3'-phosphodiesterase